MKTLSIRIPDELKRDSSRFSFGALDAGARSNFMIVAPVHRAISHYPQLQQILVHTGQRYDINMSDIQTHNNISREL